MAEKQRGWYTAFYYLAEHVRILTDGAVNHKLTYAYVGEKARYINHENPTIRKRTAASLSRIIHSSKYAEEMRERHQKDPSVFTSAAMTLCDAIRKHSTLTSDELYAYLRDAAWPDIHRGLENEREEGRKDLDSARISREMETILRHDIDALSDLISPTPSFEKQREADVLSFVKLGVTPPRHSESLLSAMLYLMAYGHLDSTLMRSLCDRAPTISFDKIEEDIPNAVEHVCLVRLGNIRSYTVSGIWEVSPDRDWTIGRYTDCAIIESEPAVSRIHCRVFNDGTTWRIEDCNSTNGTRVVAQDGSVLFDSMAQNAPASFPLSSGNRILLTDNVCYWFGAFDEVR